MESIKKYIARFMKHNKINIRYCMYCHEIVSCIKEYEKKPVDTIATVLITVMRKATVRQFLK